MPCLPTAAGCRSDTALCEHTHRAPSCLSFCTGGFTLHPGHTWQPLPAEPGVTQCPSRRLAGPASLRTTPPPTAPPRNIWPLFCIKLSSKWSPGNLASGASSHPFTTGSWICASSSHISRTEPAPPPRRGRAVKMLLTRAPSLGTSGSPPGRSTGPLPRDLGPSLSGLPEPCSAPCWRVGTPHGPGRLSWGCRGRDCLWKRTGTGCGGTRPALPPTTWDALSFSGSCMATGCPAWTWRWGVWGGDRLILGDRGHMAGSAWILGALKPGHPSALPQTLSGLG